MPSSGLFMIKHQGMQNSGADGVLATARVQAADIKGLQITEPALACRYWGVMGR